MKTQSKSLLAAVCGFVAVILVTAFANFGAFKSNNVQKGSVLVSAISK